MKPFETLAAEHAAPPFRTTVRPFPKPLMCRHGREMIAYCRNDMDSFGAILRIRDCHLSPIDAARLSVWLQDAIAYYGRSMTDTLTTSTKGTT